MAFYVTRALEDARLLFIVKKPTPRPGGDSGYSHIGLGVGALHAVKVLRRRGIRADVAQVESASHLEMTLASKPATTHVIVEAMWLTRAEFEGLTGRFPDVHFIARCHSQVGFLQVEAPAIRLIRDYLVLQDSVVNFSFAGNSGRFCRYVEEAYRSRCLLLPNLYDEVRVGVPPSRDTTAHRLLRIGSFGAIRTLKNHTTAASAALLIARRRASDLEFYLSVAREEHGAGVLAAVRHLLGGLPNVTVVEVPWAPWGNFRQTIATMDLCMQVSSSETFNLVSADAAAEGVPSVVSAAIDWLPDHWQAHIDDVDDIARVGLQLISDGSSGRQGATALAEYTRSALKSWVRYLKSNPSDG